MPVQLDQLSRKARFLGATLAGSVAECSHFVVPSLEPTAKLVEALALGKNVVSPSWVQNSFSLLKLVGELSTKLFWRDSLKFVIIFAEII